MDELKVEQYESPFDPYCSICGACGEECCCSPTMCEQHPDGHYCELYLKCLKLSYNLHEQLLKKIYENSDKYADLIEYIDIAFDIEYDKMYLSDYMTECADNKKK